MKKILLGVIIGFIIHMLYLDFILIKQHHIIDNCPIVDNKSECLKYGNATSERFYFKYFGIYSLIPWRHVVTGNWKLE